MKMTTGGLLVVATLFAAEMTDLTAQQGRRGPQMRDRDFGQELRQGGGVESIMNLRERLELTEDQMDQLDAIRRENVQRRTASMAEMTEVQSQYAAGLVRRSDVMAAKEDREEASRGQDMQQRERFQAILTDSQRESLNVVRREARSSRNDGMRGRGGQRGLRGDPGGRQRRGSLRRGRG